ncbi:MAG: transposase [Alphaproteobacteria bacterium]|nr:transposase [Alphaproteobacteria bacterium]
MTYSVDLRKRAIGFVNQGGSKAEAARVFGINRQTLYHWLCAKDIRPKRCGPRRRKLDKAALLSHVQAHPDALLRERAAHFGVHVNAIWMAMRQLDMRKKNDALR